VCLSLIAVLSAEKARNASENGFKGMVWTTMAGVLEDIGLEKGATKECCTV
jgi:hypothetical protein